VAQSRGLLTSTSYGRAGQWQIGRSQTYKRSRVDMKARDREEGQEQI